MPVVSSVVTNREWRALEDEYNLEPKSFVELGLEGHWLIDDADPEDRQAVLSLVPPIPRFLLLHGFARSYRRRAAACWGRPARPDTSRPDEWRLHRRHRRGDRRGLGRRPRRDSYRRVEPRVRRRRVARRRVVDDARRALPGPQPRRHLPLGPDLRGRGRRPVRARLANRAHHAATPTAPSGRSGSAPVDDGTEIEQTFTVVRGAKLLALLYGLIIPAHRDRTAALTEDLRRIGHLAAPRRLHRRRRLLRSSPRSGRDLPRKPSSPSGPGSAVRRRHRGEHRRWSFRLTFWRRASAMPTAP